MVHECTYRRRLTIGAGERITAVGNIPGKEELKKNPRVRKILGRGRTLMSGLGDAHTHLSWNGGDLERLGELAVEEHTLLTARSAQCYADSGYTMYALILFILFCLIFQIVISLSPVIFIFIFYFYSPPPLSTCYLSTILSDLPH